ncbi:MAG: hypothetical protein Q8L53_06170 [Aestuariivirga sp.]|nr:hypothetical protein [Aestuariivirga sp.]
MQSIYDICCGNIFGTGSLVLLLRRILLATSLLFVALQGNALAADQEAFLGFDAEYHYRTEYSHMKGHKAFAIGPQTGYGYSWGNRSSKEAENSAIKFCNKWVVQQKKHGITGKCRLYAVDSKLIVKDPRIGLAWHEPAAGADIPLSKGPQSFHIGRVPRGIVLHLHGCNGMGWNRYAEIWGSYFNALGYDFFAPDSFAEPRPAEVCGSAWRTRARDQTIILKLRVAQTLRSIAELRKRYPGLPIYVWGHSEGGSIVKYLSVEVAGIISSGDECDASGLRIAAPASVPVLYLLGENDPSVEGIKLPLTDKGVQKCRKYVRNKKTKIVIIKNSKHDIWPWRPEVAKAMSEFVGAETFTLAQSRPAEKLTLSGQQISAKALYQKSRGHRAFAANTNGTFSWVSEWEFAEDAQQFTLYDCARYEHINVFKLSKHVCSVIDADGKDMMAP